MVDAADHLVRRRPAQVLEVEPRRQHVLQRPVVQALGEVPALPLLEVHELVEEARAVLQQPADRRQPRPLDP